MKRMFAPLIGAVAVAVDLADTGVLLLGKAHPSSTPTCRLSDGTGAT